MFPFEFTNKFSRYALLSLPLCMLGAGALGAQTVLNATDLTSLRAHIATANAGTGDYTINVAAGTYTLNGTAGDADPASGDLDITRATSGNIVFAGAGAATTIIDANDVDRVFHINAGAGVIVTFRNITIRNGRAVDDGATSAQARGGGIYIESGTAVTLDRVRVESNDALGSVGNVGSDATLSGANGGDGNSGAAAYGAGIFGQGATLTITASTLSLNSAQGGQGGQGGIGGSSTSSNGSASGGNGGDGGAGGDASGGAIFMAGGTLNIISSTLNGCSTEGGEGGPGGAGGNAFASASSSSSSANASGGRGGAGGAGGLAFGGGIYVDTGTVNIVNSTFDNLGAFAGSGGTGGVGGNASGSGFVSSSGGSGGTGGSGGSSLGGGIFLTDGTATINNSTVADCSAVSGNPGIGGAGGSPGGSTGSDGSITTSAGGGAFLSPGAGVFTVNGSIFAGSVADFGEDVLGNFTAGASLFQVAPAGTLTPGTGANITGQDPLLQPLADNGGPTFTRALGAGSPAIDAGSNPLSLTIDQRGGNYVRVFGPAADMGAFEVQPAGGAGGGGGDDDDDDGSCSTSEGISWYSLLGILAALMLSVRRMFTARRT